MYIYCIFILIYIYIYIYMYIATSSGDDPEKGVQSEDCLYLNIWTPSTGNYIYICMYVHICKCIVIYV
jgi:hypothetical protein